MSKSVDVLSVMDRAAGGLFAYSHKLSAETMRARDAVSELIAAADEAGVRLSLAMSHSEDLVAHMRLCAALARVQESP